MLRVPLGQVGSRSKHASASHSIDVKGRCPNSLSLGGKRRGVCGWRLDRDLDERNTIALDRQRCWIDRVASLRCCGARQPQTQQFALERELYRQAIAELLEPFAVLRKLADPRSCF